MDGAGDGGLPADALDLLISVSKALDQSGAQWMVAGRAAEALLGLDPWPENGFLELMTTGPAEFRFMGSLKCWTFFTGGRMTWSVTKGSLRLIGHNPSGWYRDSSALSRAVRLPSNNLSVPPLEYLLLDALRNGVPSARQILEARGQVDWAFIDDVLANERNE